MDEAVKTFCERGMAVMIGDIAVNRNAIIKVTSAVGKFKKRSTFALLIGGVALYVASKLTTENDEMKKTISNLESRVEELETMKG